MAKRRKAAEVIALKFDKAPKPVREQYLDLAKKGFKEPSSLTPDEIWHLCRAMIFYTAQLDKLL